MTTPDDGAGTTTLEPNPRLITPAFLLAWVINFSQYLCFYFLVTTMALYAVKEFAASNAAGGFASSAFVVGATVARLFSGYCVDRIGRRPVMMGALVLVVIACVLYIPVGSLPLLIIVRLVHGFGYAFVSTATMAVAQSVIPAARRAEGTGYFGLGATLAAALGPAVGLFLVGASGYTTLFLTALVVSVLGLLLGLALRSPRTGSTAEPESGTPPAPRFSLRSMLHPAVIPIGVFMLLVGVCYAGVITYINAYAEARDVATGAGLFFITYAIATLIMRFILGRVQDRRGDNVVIYFGLFFFAIALLVLASATTDWQVILAGVACGLGYGSLMPAAQTISVSVVPTNQMGTGISTMLLLADLGIGLGPILLGVLLSATGFGTMYLILAAGVVVAAVFYALTHGRTDRARGRTGHAPTVTEEVPV